MAKENLKRIVTEIINDIKTNGEVTHPEGETTTPIVRDLICCARKVDNDMSALVSDFTIAQLFDRAGGVSVLEEILIKCQ